MVIAKAQGQFFDSIFQHPAAYTTSDSTNRYSILGVYSSFSRQNVIGSVGSSDSSLI